MSLNDFDFPLDAVVSRKALWFRIECYFSASLLTLHWLWTSCPTNLQDTINDIVVTSFLGFLVLCAAYIISIGFRVMCIVILGCIMIMVLLREICSHNRRLKFNSYIAPIEITKASDLDHIIRSEGLLEMRKWISSYLPAIILLNTKSPSPSSSPQPTSSNYQQMLQEALNKHKVNQAEVDQHDKIEYQDSFSSLEDLDKLKPNAKKSKMKRSFSERFNMSFSSRSRSFFDRKESEDSVFSSFSSTGDSFRLDMFKSSSTDESYDSRNQLHKQMSLYSLNARNKKSSNRNDASFDDIYSDMSEITNSPTRDNSARVRLSSLKLASIDEHDYNDSGEDGGKLMRNGNESLKNDTKTPQNSYSWLSIGNFLKGRHEVQTEKQLNEVKLQQLKVRSKSNDNFGLDAAALTVEESVIFDEQKAPQRKSAKFRSFRYFDHIS